MAVRKRKTPNDETSLDGADLTSSRKRVKTYSNSSEPASRSESQSSPNNVSHTECATNLVSEISELQTQTQDDNASKSSSDELEPENKLLTLLENQIEQSGEDIFVVKYLSKKALAKSASSKKTRKRSITKKRGIYRVLDQQLFIGDHLYGYISYEVSNPDLWTKLMKYKRCTLNNQSFGCGQCVFIRSEETQPILRDDSSETEDQVLTTEGFDLKSWKAVILEIRALDESHVYLLVAWLYRPAYDLPNGAEPYHGNHELIPSNELAIIDAKTINGLLDVNYWDEMVEDVQYNAGDYFWRQTYDFTKQKLSPSRPMCKCKQPQNPDHPIVQCNTCSRWMHRGCLEKEAIQSYLIKHPPPAKEESENADSKNNVPEIISKSGSKTRKRKRVASTSKEDVDTTNPSDDIEKDVSEKVQAKFELLPSEKSDHPTYKHTSTTKDDHIEEQTSINTTSLTAGIKGWVKDQINHIGEKVSESTSNLLSQDHKAGRSSTDEPHIDIENNTDKEKRYMSTARIIITDRRGLDACTVSRHDSKERDDKNEERDNNNNEEKEIVQGKEQGELKASSKDPCHVEVIIDHVCCLLCSEDL